MRQLFTLFLTACLVACAAGLAQAQLLTNGDLDAGSGQTIPGWSLNESKTFSGPTTDIITSEPWPELPPITNGGGDADRALFFKSFQGNSTTGDLATGHLYQDVAGNPFVQYTLTGSIGAGINYSGLLTGPTKSEMAIEFDNDNVFDNGGDGVRTAGIDYLSAAVLDLKAAGLTSGAFPGFGSQSFLVSGSGPAGTLFVRARVSMIDGYATQNPDQAMFVDDLNLVPEPASVVLGLLGLVSVCGFARRR